MQIFIDASGIDNEQEEYLLQIFSAFTNTQDAAKVVFVNNKAEKIDSFSQNIWVQAPPPSFINKLKPDSGYKDFVTKAMREGNGGSRWITNQANHILPNHTDQILIVTDLGFLQHPQWYNKKTFNKKIFSQAFENASKIIVPSLYHKNMVHNEFGVNENKIGIVLPKPSFFAQPLSWEEKEMMKKTYTDGKDYFVYSTTSHPRHEFINLLKAFSIFKKRQQSSMQLVILYKAKAASKDILEKIDTYKYKSDVHLADVEEKEQLRIIAASYAMVYPVAIEDIPLAIINAAYCEVPAISSDLPVIKEFAGNAVAYADPKNVDDLAHNMILLYKDEKLRRELIEKMKGKIAS